MRDEKLKESLLLLEEALKEYDKNPKSRLWFLAVSKAYEVSFEYFWKALKRECDKAGLEIYSPRDSLRGAQELNLINDIERWNSFLHARNLSVHDYIGMNEKEFIPLIKDFSKSVFALLK